MAHEQSRKGLEEKKVAVEELNNARPDKINSRRTRTVQEYKYE
jgi:hypothetical protein